MKIRPLGLFLLLLLLESASFGEHSHPNTFITEEGGQTNAFLDDTQAQVHVLLRPENRLVFAFPSENSGIGLWFRGHLEMISDSVRSLPGGGGQEVEIRCRVHRSTAVEKTLLDSIRVLRDENVGADTADQVEVGRAKAGSMGWALLSKEATDQGLLFHREQPGGRGDFELEIRPARLSEGGQPILDQGEVRIRVRCPFPPMTGYSNNDLYRPEFLAVTAKTDSRTVNSLKALEFLARREKLMAGSWRFLTYFGRDTLISAAMLEPILSDAALTAAVESVLVRLAPSGMVAHEEDIGPWAEWRHLQANEAPSLEPVYDYKMIDDDLLLPLLLAKLKENGRGAVVERLLKNPADRTAILKNASYVLERLESGQPLRLKVGESTGDWRDSHEGLGGGVYPASVNAALAVATLDALAGLLPDLDPQPKDLIAKIGGLRKIWSDIAKDYWMTLSAEQVQARIGAFEKTLSGPRKRGFQNLVAQHQEFLDRRFRFPILSKTDGLNPVVVAHTDVAFSLFYGRLKHEELEEILTLLERPFPFGLKTAAGYVVANPIFSSDTDHYKTLGFGQYHGLVVWSWPSAMLQLGLMRQLGQHPEVAQRLQTLLNEIQQSEERVGALATSELWAIDLTDSGITWRAYGTSGDQTESNALQLWSTVYPALEFVRDSMK